jgi:glyoxylase-like metal-dependent hydrolase (beta-lactamase superfamily II)
MATGTRNTIGAPVVEGVGRIPGFVNCYTYSEGDQQFLIDTGFSRKAKSITRAFRDSNVPMDRVGKILLTHHHVDHMGGAAFLVENFHVPLACHADDAPFVDGRTKTTTPLLLRPFMRVHHAPVSASLKDGDRIGPLLVVHTPGHTPGAVVYYHPVRKILFSGDAVVERKGQLTMPAVRFATSLERAVQSLSRIRELDVDVLLPGHGVPVTANVPSLLDDLIRRAPADFLRRPSG